MNKYIIEREVPGAAKFTGLELREISLKACEIIREVDPGIKWIHSYITGDKIFCVYEADSEEIVRKSSEMAGLPVSKITLIEKVITPEIMQ